MKQEKEIKVKSNEVTEPKKQKVSATYTLRSMSNGIKKLEELELISYEQSTMMHDILKTAINLYINNLTT